MKSSMLLAMALLAGGSIQESGAAPSKIRREAATHESLVALRQQVEQKDPVRNLKPAQGVDPTTVNQPADLRSQSDIICFRGMATFVPKRAIIHMPANLKDRLIVQPDARLHSWADFYAANRGWITTVEISRVQAEGKQPLGEDMVKIMGKSANLMVATYKGGPISLLPLKVPEQAVPTPTVSKP